MSADRRIVISRNLMCILFVSIFLYTLAASYVGMASAQETGRIDVSIEGYDGASVLTATLFDSSRSVIENKTGNEPSFSFENLVLGERYTVLVNYKAVDYPVTITVNQTSQRLAIRVFDVTSSDDDVVVSLYQVYVERGDGYLDVTEYIQFDNSGGTVINNATLKIAIPEGYKNFVWNQDCCLESADFGIFFRPTGPLLPNGTKTINFKYSLDPSADEYSLLKRFYYETTDVFVLVDSGLTVASYNNLWEQGSIPGDDHALDVYGASEFLKGESVLITVTGYKSSSDLNLLWVGTGVLVAIIVGGIVYGFRGSRGSTKRLKSEEDALISVTKQIDRDFADKKITEVEYYKLQLKYKEQLEKVRKRIRRQEKK